MVKMKLSEVKTNNKEVTKMTKATIELKFMGTVEGCRNFEQINVKCNNSKSIEYLTQMLIEDNHIFFKSPDDLDCTKDGIYLYFELCGSFARIQQGFYTLLPLVKVLAMVQKCGSILLPDLSK
jgi:hypothetical protein